MNRTLLKSVFCALDTEEPLWPEEIERGLEIHACVHERFSLYNGYSYCRHPSSCRSWCRFYDCPLGRPVIRGWHNRLQEPLAPSKLIYQSSILDFQESVSMGYCFKHKLQFYPCCPECEKEERLMSKEEHQVLS